MINKVKKKEESVRAEKKAETNAKESVEKITSAKDAKKVEAEKNSDQKHKRP
ncbi:hypothetical protein ABIB40_002802 [Pedobacter sp. UYP30]|uniref:hypothetical protein n=1 Tax=Pedobacter sp. UYP30 TaxID=1756400 RepID=UPI0033974D35